MVIRTVVRLRLLFDCLFDGSEGVVCLLIKSGQKAGLNYVCPSFCQYLLLLLVAMQKTGADQHLPLSSLF